MSTDYTEIVDAWLTRLNEFQPADGKLTDEILAMAGPFPVYRPPGDAYDYRDDPEKSYQYDTAIEARVYALERAKFRMQMATAKSTGQKTEKREINARYWADIVAWLRSIR